MAGLLLALIDFCIFALAMEIGIDGQNTKLWNTVADGLMLAGFLVFEASLAAFLAAFFWCK